MTVRDVMHYVQTLSSQQAELFILKRARGDQMLVRGLCVAGLLCALFVFMV